MYVILLLNFELGADQFHDNYTLYGLCHCLYFHMSYVCEFQHSDVESQLGCSTELQLRQINIERLEKQHAHVKLRERF